MGYIVRIARFPKFTVDAVVRPLVLILRHLHDHFIPHQRNNYHPHILGQRALGLFSAMLVALKIFTLVLISVGPILPAYSSAITSQNIVSLTNDSRKTYGLQSLAYNELLAKSAQAKANDMLARGYFSHNTPDGKAPWTFIQAAGYNYIMAGENLAVNFTEAENVEEAWMNSPGHKANILNKNFEEIGIGIAQGTYQGHNAIFVVQMFGTPVEQKVTLSESPTLVQVETVPPPAPVKLVTPATTPKVVTVRSENTKAPAPAPETPVVLAAPTPIEVSNAVVVLEENKVLVSAQASDSAVKVIAYFGELAVMLEPKSEGFWKAEIPLSTLAEGKLTVRVKGYDIAGKTAEIQLAEFSGSTVQNFHVLGAESPANKVSFMGKIFNPKVFEQKFYLLFIAGLLSSLILAIVIKKHIQHVALIANSSFVIILATLLLSTG
jgi:uncharacterized protein YkwD